MYSVKDFGTKITRIVYQHIHPAESGYGSIHDFCGCLRVTDVTIEQCKMLVIGGMVNRDERTVQLEGITDEPTGPDLGRLKELYFARFPGGRDRQHWPGLTYIRVRPQWLRFSDFNQSPPVIAEFTF